MKKCVVTGGAGFIGSHLVDALLDRGCEVTVIDNMFTGSLSNIHHNLKNSKFKLKRMSILHNGLKDIFSEADTIFHLAAIPRVQYSISHPYLTQKVNLEGTLNVLEFARRTDVDKIIFSSSSSVYGDQSSLPLKECMSPHPMSPYGVQKLAGEQYMQLYYDLYGIKTVILRYFNVYGPRDDPTISPPRLIPHTIYLLKNNKSPIIYGNGTQTRDFTYVKDVVNATVLATHIKNKKLFGQPINTGTGINTSVIDIINILKKLLKKDITPIYKRKLKEPIHSQADIQRAKDILKWSPETSLSNGIELTINWIESIPQKVIYTINKI